MGVFLLPSQVGPGFNFVQLLFRLVSAYLSQLINSSSPYLDAEVENTVELHTVRAAASLAMVEETIRHLEKLRSLIPTVSQTWKRSSSIACVNTSERFI